MNNIEKQNHTDFINIMPIIRKGFQKWYIFVIIGFLCGSGAIVYYKLTKPTYKILSNVLIKDEEKSGVASMQAAMMKGAFGGLLGGSVKLYDELEMLKSFSVFKSTIKKLKLNESYKSKKGFKNKIFYSDSPIQLTPIIDIADTLETTIFFDIDIEKSGKGKIKAYTGMFHKNRGEVAFEKLPVILHTYFGDFTVSTTNFYKASESYKLKVAYEGYNAVAEKYQEKVDIDLTSKKADLLTLSIDEKNKKRGQDILNTLITEYNRIGIEQRKSKAANTLRFIDERIQIIALELSDIEYKIEDYKKKNDMTDITAEVKAIFENSGELRSRQTEVETQYTIMDMMEKFISNPENRYSQVPFNIGLTDRNVLEGLQKYNDALLERMKLEKYTHEDNPMVQMSNEQLEVMRSNILATIRSLKTGFSLTRDDLRKQEDQFLTRLKNMPTQEREFIDIKRQQYLKQELYMFLLQQKEENMLNQSIPTPRASVIDKAYYLNKPLKPKLLNSLMFAMGISFCLSILWINRKKIMTMNNK